MKRLLCALLFAVTMQATTVSSITCSSQTATVNATAHGLIASQGFELTGTSPQFNGTASTVTTNSFTFKVPTGTNCSIYTSGYTVVVPAQQIIQLPAVANPQAGTVQFNFLGWFTTVYPNPLPSTTVSVWSAANAAQNAAIVAGTTVEMYVTFTDAANTPAATVQAQAVSLYNTMQVAFANFLLAQGYCYNGGSWSTTCQ